MRELKNIWSLCAKIFLPLGFGLFALYIILGSILGFGGGILAVALNGGVWAVIGGVCWVIAQNGRYRSERLKREGLCYDAEVIRLVPNMMIRINASYAMHAECGYINAEGKTCLVRSGLFTMPSMGIFANGPIRAEANKDGLESKVYVNKNDPRDYFVEIRENDKIADIKADYDYR